MFWSKKKLYDNFKKISMIRIINSLSNKSILEKNVKYLFYFDILNTILLISLLTGLILIIVKYKKIRISNKKYSSSYNSDSDGDSDEEEDFQVDCNCNICKEHYAKPYNTY
jgi:hypothetical protein